MIPCSEVARGSTARSIVVLLPTSRGAVALCQSGTKFHTLVRRGVIMNKNWIKFVVAGIVALVCGILALVFPTLTLFVLAATGGFAIVVYKWEWMRAKQKAFSERRKVRAEARKARVVTDASSVTESDVATTRAAEPAWRQGLKLAGKIIGGALFGAIGGALVAAMIAFVVFLVQDQFGPTPEIRNVVQIITTGVWIALPILGAIFGVLATTKEK